MLNTMPLPVGPKEVPGGIPKPELQRKAPERVATGEDTASFASTLESIHQKSQTTGDSANQADDDTSGVQSAFEKEDGENPPENLPDPADGVAALMAHSPVTPNMSLDRNLSAQNSEATAVNETTPAFQETEVMKMVVENLKQTDTTPAFQETEVMKMVVGNLKQTDTTLDTIAPRIGTVANTGIIAGVNNEETTPDLQLQGGPQVLKTGVKSVEADNSGMGAHVSPNGVEESHQTLQALGETPDRKMLRKMQTNTVEGLPKKEAQTDNTLGKLHLLEDEPQLTNQDKQGKQLLHKGTENRPPELEGPMPGKLKAEMLDFQTIRSQASETSPEGTKTFGEKGADSPITVTTDETGTMAGRSGVFDSTLSFTSSPAVGKGVMAATNSAATPQGVTSETFPQENFNQLVERALFTVRGEQSEARIALKPDHLGHVQMKIVTENNIVSIKIVTETPVARDLIDANANQLKAELQQQGLSVETIEVSVSDDQHNAYRQARQRESLLRHMASQGDSSAEEDGEGHENRPEEGKNNRNSGSGIDYFA